MKEKFHLFKIIFVCIVLSMCCSIPLLSTVKGEDIKGTRPSWQEIEKNVQEWMKAGKIPGLTLVIIKSDEPVFIKGYGYADLDKKTPVTDETLFELASCSKSFTALALIFYYRIVAKISRGYMEEARDTQNVYMRKEDRQDISLIMSFPRLSPSLFF